MEKFVLANFETLAVLIGCYLVIGTLLATIGPAGKAISDAIKKFSNSLIYAVDEQKPPPAWKILIFRVLLTAVMILMWPLFIWGIIKEQKSLIQFGKNRIKKSTGLRFQYMGGGGSIHCRECNHSESVISCIHGINFINLGFQCQLCGKITSLTGEGQDRTCKCGGKLEREKILFCPQCKSKNLSYKIEFIT